MSLPGGELGVPPQGTQNCHGVPRARETRSNPVPALDLEKADKSQGSGNRNLPYRGAELQLIISLFNITGRMKQKGTGS